MAENFDLIFGQNASQQYAWNDTDYQNGWETIGNIPPTAAQFDALQRRSDTKMKELNDGLTPLVNADTADNRQPSTAYSEGDIKYSPLLPTGWFLTCTTAGITSASEIVLPTPIAENDTVTDGTVTWEIHKIGTGNGGDGVPLGAIIQYSVNGDLPSGYLLCDGAAYSRAMFPDLFAAIGTTYGVGDGSTTFNVPDYNTAQRFAQGGTVAGTAVAAGLPNITGSVNLRYFVDANGSNTVKNGALQIANGADGPNALTISGIGNQRTISLDASQSDPIYGASDTVQPNALTCRYIIKAFDEETPDSALIDVTQYAQELAGKADRALDNLSTDGENHFLERDFTIIYPNGGSESSPANVTTNSRYVESNPFSGYRVNCVVEVLFNNQWGNPMINYISTAGYGAAVNQLDDDTIVLQTGGGGLIVDSTAIGSPFGYSGATNTTPLPCRVKVWKIGKIPD